jgi:hypothetical protein
MWGRIIGIAAGLALIVEAYLLWRPDAIGAWPDPDLGPFSPYRTIVAGLAAALGAAVAIAAFQRGSHQRRAKPAFDWDAPAAAPPPEPVTAPAAEPEPDAKDPFALEPFPGTAREPEAAPAPPPVLGLPAPASTPEPEPEAAAPAGSSSDYGRYLACVADGDALRAEGNLGEAIEPYSDALAIARTRCAAWPEDPAVQRDLAASLTHVADVHDLDGRLDAALDLHQQSLDIRKALAAAAPRDLTAQKSLALGLERMADSREARGHRSRARDLFRERLALLEPLAAEAPGDADLTRALDITRERLAELDAALAPPAPAYTG